MAPEICQVSFAVTKNDERIKLGYGSKFHVYVPADDLTDPAPATTFAHLDATTVLSRGLAAKDKSFKLVKDYYLAQSKYSLNIRPSNSTRMVHFPMMEEWPVKVCAP
ncbi:hypothetical protein Ahy_B02g057798 [Arachis hypogaea]|uniref:H(+)-transporting two-sector ATPase n=1 Tax=Arachis hypogaea TaxID=3818 RepID=A0A445ACU2_ARAHY|nr:hypothetical protein Ahy_B02g057798 [Arachis hypogaea]